MKKSWEVNENRFWKQTYYDDKYIKAKIKTYADIIITNFNNQKNAKKYHVNVYQ